MRNDAICRIGVFYDGSYFQYAQKHLYHKRDLGWIQFRPFHELLQEYIRSKEQTYVTHRIVYAAWFQGLFDSRQSEQHLRTDRNLHHDLMHCGIQVKYLPMSQSNKEKGVDVAFAVDALQVGISGQMDVAILVTGDGDLVPLVRTLMQHGVRVAIAYFEYEEEEGAKSFANDRLLSASNYQLNVLQCEQDKQFGTLYRAMFFKKP